MRKVSSGARSCTSWAKMRVARSRASVPSGHWWEIVSSLANAPEADTNKLKAARSNAGMRMFSVPSSPPYVPLQQQVMHAPHPVGIQSMADFRRADERLDGRLNGKDGDRLRVGGLARSRAGVRLARGARLKDPRKLTESLQRGSRPPCAKALNRCRDSRCAGPGRRAR